MKISDYLNNFNFKTKPFKHQLECLKYGIKNSRFILGDEQGLGKTKEAVDLAIILKDLYKYQRCLIICGVASLRYNWANEIHIHSDYDCWILGERIKKTGRVDLSGNKEKIADLQDLIYDTATFPYFLIMNVEALRNDSVYKRLLRLIELQKINMIVFDEIHECKEPTAIQTQRLMGLKAETMIGMSGTLVLNNPMDVYAPLFWIGAIDYNFYQFRRYFCLLGGMKKTEVVGYKNQQQLRELVKVHMLRRRRDEVLDLPPKIRDTVYLEMGSQQKAIYKEIVQETLQNIDKIKLSTNPNPLVEFIRLRQATAHTGLLSSTVYQSVKFDRMKQIIEEAVAYNDKVIVYSNWHEVCALAKKELAKYNPAIYTGEIPNCEEELQRFKTNPSCKVIIGTIRKLGVGQTLTMASTEIFLDSPWNKTRKEQAEDRAYRIGTTKPLNIITLCCKGTMDEVVESIIYKKGIISDYLTDGQISNKKMLNYILGVLADENY
jgi:SNF2 family DNA or RNA helicase